MDLQSELKKTGLVKPLPYRVWNWLKDHPNKSYKEIAVAIGESVHRVSQALTSLVGRGMVIRTYHTRGAATYVVRYQEYEVLPYTKCKPTPPQEDSMDLVIPPAEHTPTEHTPVGLGVRWKDLETVKEMYNLYTELHKIFGKGY